MALSVSEIATIVGGTFEGDGDILVERLASLLEAKEGDLSFLSNPKYADDVAKTRASAVLVSADFAKVSSAGALVRVKNPDKAFAKIAGIIAPPPPVRLPGIHPTAVVAEDAVIGEGVHIGPLCVIESGAKIGANSVIEARVYIGENSEIGPGSHIYPGVTIRERIRIGARFIAHPGAVIGADGFGFSIEMEPSGVPRIEKIPQVGIVVIGDDVEVGANTTIDRARFGETRIGNCVKIDNLVQIGHNVKIGDFSGVIAQAGIAGSATIESGVRIWAQAGISGHLTVHSGAQVGPQCGVARDVPPGEYVFGTPATSLREVAAISAAPGRIVKMRREIAEIKAEISKIKEGLSK